MTKTEAASRCQDCTDLAREIFMSLVTGDNAKGVNNIQAENMANHALGMAEIFTVSAIRREAAFSTFLRQKTEKKEVESDEQS